MLRRMSKTAFGGRELGQAFEVLSAMAADPDCTIVVTVSGAMTWECHARLFTMCSHGEPREQVEALNKKNGRGFNGRARNKSFKLFAA